MIACICLLLFLFFFLSLITPCRWHVSNPSFTQWTTTNVGWLHLLLLHWQTSQLMAHFQQVFFNSHQMFTTPNILYFSLNPSNTSIVCKFLRIPLYSSFNLYKTHLPQVFSSLSNRFQQCLRISIIADLNEIWYTQKQRTKCIPVDKILPPILSLLISFSPWEFWTAKYEWLYISTKMTRIMSSKGKLANKGRR